MSRKNVLLYALSTCIYCKKTKELLDQLCPEGYACLNVDLLEGEERKEALARMAEHNPARSFPTVIIDKNVIVGFKQDEIKKYLEKKGES